MKKSMLGWRSVSAVALLVLSAGAASADPLTGQQILSTYNLVTSGNASTNSDIVGNAVIGGNLNGATFFGGGNNIPASPVLSVYGSLTTPTASTSMRAATFSTTA
jgi:hypothetical protein